MKGGSVCNARYLVYVDLWGVFFFFALVYSMLWFLWYLGSFFVFLLFSRSGSLVLFVLKVPLLIVCIVSIVVMYSSIFFC